MAAHVCHGDYDGYLPSTWVFTSKEPENPGIVLGEVDDGVKSSFYVLFLKKVHPANDGEPRHDWMILPSFLYDSSDKAKAAAARKKGFKR